MATTLARLLLIALVALLGIASGQTSTFWKDASLKWGSGGFGRLNMSSSAVAYPGSISVTLDVWIRDITVVPGEDPLIECTIRHSPPTGSAWIDLPMEFYMQKPGLEDDVYQGVMSFVPGSYQFNVFCTFNNSEEVWLDQPNFPFTVNPISCGVNEYASSTTECASCPVNSTSQPGSASINNCQCQGDLILDVKGKACVPSSTECPANQYSSDGKTCQSCPEHSSGPGGAGGLSTLCTCSGGRVMNQDEAECQCAANSYEASGTCAACPSLSHSPQGSTELEDCVCEGFLVLSSITKTCRDPISFVGNLSPSGAPVVLEFGEPLVITLEVFKSGVTSSSGRGAEISCYVHFSSPLPSDYTGGWDPTSDLAMAYHDDIGENDRYRLALTPAPGYYGFAAYCLDANSAEKHWNDGSGKAQIKAASCGPNFYLSNLTACIACPQFSSGPAHSSSISACVCDTSLGLWLNLEQGKCFKSCPENQYFDAPDCKECPSGATSPANSTGSSSCSCSSGYSLRNGVCTRNIDWLGFNLQTGGNPHSRQFPSDMLLRLEVYQEGVTGVNHPVSPNLRCTLLGSPVSSYGGSWDSIFQLAMTYTSKANNNDVFEFDLATLSVGKYELTAYCSDDNGAYKAYRNDGNLQIELLGADCGEDEYAPADQKSCLDCPANSTRADTGGQSLSDCQCSEGLVMDPASATCFESCEENQYLNKGCHDCPLNATLSVSPSFSVKDCVCPTGHFLRMDSNDAYHCAPCPTGTYGGGDGPCTACPPGSSSHFGSTLESDCSCIAGYVDDEGSCAACEENTFWENGSCEPCPEGTFSKPASFKPEHCTAPGEMPPLDMGAMPEEGGVGFRVWSPNAIAVTLEVGSAQHPMAYEQDRATWYVFVEDVAAGTSYRYLINNGADQAKPAVDPYARRLSANLEFSIVHDPSFDWEGFQFLPEKPSGYSLVIYELHIETFTEEGTLQSAVERLDYLQELGVNAIELLPVIEFTGDKNWGYDTVHLFSIENAYGGMDAMKEFVREAHKRGLAVMVDLLVNHLHVDNLLAKFDGFDDEYIDGPYFYEKGERLETSWGPRPNFDLPMVRKMMLDNVRVWMLEFGVDGFRWDATVCVRRPSALCWESDKELQSGIQLLQEGNALVKALGGITTAEDLNFDPRTTNSSSSGFGFELEWDPSFQVIATEDLLYPAFQHLSFGRVSSLLTPPTRRIIYTETHDKANPRIPGVVGASRAAASAMLGLSLLAVSPGAALIFQGQEFAFEPAFTFFPSPPKMDWTQVGSFSGEEGWSQGPSPQRGLFLLARDLFRLKLNLANTTAGLQGDRLEVLMAEKNQGLLAFRRWKTPGARQDDTLILLNFAPTPSHLRLGVPASGVWKVRFNGDLDEYSANGTAPLPSFTSSSVPSNYKANSIELSIAPHAMLVLSQDHEITPTSTPTPTPTPTPTTTSARPTTTTSARPTTTAPPATTTAAQPGGGPKDPVVKVTLRIVNLSFSWYSSSQSNADAFLASFVTYMANLLGIPESYITVESVSSGSLVVDFTVRSPNPSEVKTQVDTFIGSNPDLTPMVQNLPAEAFEDPSLGASIDAENSSSSVQKPKGTNVGAIVGGVIGGLIGLLIIAGVAIFLVRRRKERMGGAIELQDKSKG